MLICRIVETGRAPSLLALLLIFCGNTIIAQKKTNIILEQSETLSFDKPQGFQVLRGNVRFRHDNAVMYCDSAYFYEGKNSFDAFGNVRIVQDSLTLVSNKMFYDGDIRLAKAREKVVMNDGKLIIYTDYMDFDRIQNFGYYFNGGKLVDPQFVLTSKTGYHYPDTKRSFFKTDVVVVNPDFRIESDTLQYNSLTEVIRLVGPSHIFYEDATVYTTNGWANTQKNYGMLYDYSVITSKDGKRMTADSIAFDREAGWSKAYHNAEVQDSVRKTIVYGDYGIFYENPQSGLMTQRPYMIDYSSPDTLFLHADTLSFVAPDSVTNILKAYHRVRFFREDFQGKCDSLVYISTDSVIDMYKAPVLWSDENQLSGDLIKIYLKDSVPDWIHITSNAMIISQEEDSINFNQLSGRESKGYIIEGELRKIDMIGNAISIYFPKDSDDDLIGVNKAEGSLMNIYLKEKKLEKIVMTPDSKGVLYPPDKVPKEQLFLKNFTWQDKIRPKDKDDIFRHE
jgi:lipopolysaccharide export system protein LptA